MLSVAIAGGSLRRGSALDVDPTNDHVPPDRHVTVAWGRDYADVTPVRGVVIGPAATQELSVSVDVQRVLS
jgi:transglutaminase-like putative cysteine protease